MELHPNSPKGRGFEIQRCTERPLSVYLSLKIVMDVIESALLLFCLHFKSTAEINLLEAPSLTKKTSVSEETIIQEIPGIQGCYYESDKIAQRKMLDFAQKQWFNWKILTRKQVIKALP